MTKSTLSYTCKQIAKMTSNGTMKFDNAIQRQEVWKNKRKSLFIDSILKGYPVPPLYVVKTNETTLDSRGRTISIYDCIDGKQRCSTIHAFRNDELKLVGLEDAELNNKYYSELNEDQRDTFDSYTLSSYLLSDVDDDEIADMMSRLNNGKPLTNTEMARIKSKDLDTIHKLAESPILTKNLTEAALNGYANEDIIVKLYLVIYKENFELSSKNVRDTFENDAFTQKQVSEITKILEVADKAYDIIIKEAPRKVYKKSAQKTNLLSILNIIHNNPKHSDPNTIASFAMHFFSPEQGIVSISEAYNNGMTNGTNHQKNVMARFEAIAGEFEKFCKGKGNDDAEEDENKEDLDQMTLV